MEVYNLKKMLFIFMLSIILVGCSNSSSNDSDILSDLAYSNFKQLFSFDEEKSVTMTVEGYEYGKRNSEPLMYFGNNFKGDGEIQFSYFRPDFSTNSSQLIESFEVAAIKSRDSIISHKIINTSPYMSYVFDEAKAKHITKNGEYIIGAYGYVSDEEASKATTKFPVIEIQERMDFIEAYKNHSLVYLVVVEVQ